MSKTVGQRLYWLEEVCFCLHCI